MRDNRDPYPFHRARVNVHIPLDVDIVKVVKPKLSWWQRLIVWLNNP